MLGSSLPCLVRLIFLTFLKSPCSSPRYHFPATMTRSLESMRSTSGRVTLQGVGGAVRKMREEAKLSVREVARRLKMNHGTYSKYETSARPLSLAFIERCADAIKVSRETAVLRCIRHAY